jgi:hypothetical protein
MQLENWKPRSDWGKRFLANAEAEMRAGMRAVVEAEVRAVVEAEVRAVVAAEVRAKARAASILDVFEARGLPIEPTLRQRITACTDLGELTRWLRRAVTVSSPEEVFAS